MNKESLERKLWNVWIIILFFNKLCKILIYIYLCYLKYHTFWFSISFTYCSVECQVGTKRCLVYQHFLNIEYLLQQKGEKSFKMRCKSLDDN